MYILMWLAIFIVLLVIEFSTVNLVSIWFAISAIIAMIIAAVGVDISIQILVFTICGVLLLICTRDWAKKQTKNRNVKTNYEAIIGKNGIALEDIKKENKGYVKVEGLEWSAQASEEIKKDEKIKVTDIEGAHLKIKKYS